MRLASRPPLERLAIIDREIRNGSWPNARQLAKTLEVNHRTVQRDLTFLRDRLKAPLKYHPSRHGYFYTDQNYFLPSIQLTEGELVALFLAERVLQQFGKTPFGPALATAFKKLTRFLPDHVAIDLSHLGEAFSIRLQSAGPGDLERFTCLQQAVKECKQLELLYWTASRNHTGKRLVDPYHLTSIDGDWYLIAYCHRRKQTLMFSPARIRDLRETGIICRRPADFSIAAYLHLGFRKVRGIGPAQTVRLRFCPEAAKYVREKEWHTTQILKEESDGHLVLSFQVNHFLEIKRWVLSFGADCEVLEPAELQQLVHDEAARILKDERNNRGVIHANN